MTDELERQLAVLKGLFEAGQMDPATYQAAVTALQATRYQGEAAQGSAVAQDHSIAAAQGAFVNTGIIEGNVYLGEPTDDPAEALRIYRQVLVSSSEQLPLRTIDVRASNPRAGGRLRLTNVYIDLNTTTREQERRPRRALEGRPADRREQEKELPPISALQAVIRNRKLVITGDPGSGKSTFVNHLTYCLAEHALQPDDGWLAHLAGWPATEAQLLPLPVVLRDFAADPQIDRTQAPTVATLWGFIERRLQNQNLAFVARPLARQLDRGAALVLLDGLDEVTGADQRLFVRDAVRAFVRRYPQNRYLVTCRILAYQPPTHEDEPDLRLDGSDFPVYQLAPFDPEQIDRFIAAWYAELVRLNSVSQGEADDLAPGLQQAVRRPDLWRMAPNPLLLSVMALLHAHQSGRLPDARAELYEQAVEMLLWRWDEKKQSGVLRELLTQAGRTDLDLKRVLWKLAYEAHSGTDPTAGSEALGDIAESALTRALERLKPGDWTWAHTLVDAMKLRAGLLLEREPGIFTFPHRTFQEYLAGVYLSNLNDFSTQGNTLAAQGSHWREALLLAVGQLTQQGKIDSVLMLPQRLAVGGTADVDWRRAWLAGDAIREIGVQRVADDAVGSALLPRVRGRLASLVDGGHLTPRERAEAGVTLAALGDERPGVGARVIGGQAWPDILFDYVPPGPFWMGSAADDQQAYDDEKPLHQVDIPYGYWIARYPLTVAQWRAFTAAAGYTPLEPPSLQGAANQPAVWLTWHDAMALCRRLSQEGRNAGWLPEGLSINLPSEAEWEKAARGGLQLPTEAPTARLGERFPATPRPAWQPNPSQQRRYPWGDEPADAARANYDAVGIGRPAPVGAFPAGAGPYRALDLAGNVWEWTRSRFEAYPYKPDDGREDLERFRDSTWIAWRGGAYYGEARRVRCASRYNLYFPLRGDVLGVRVVASPFSPLVSDASDL